MRRSILCGLLLASLTGAQFKSTVPLVLAPATVTDAKGHYVDGLTSEDLVLYDNNVPQRIQLDWMLYPISLVVAIQSGANAGAVIDKVGRSGILFTQLVAAEAGQTALFTFSDDVRLHQPFTSDPDQITQSLRMLRIEGGGAHILDALGAAFDLLEKVPPGRRRIVLMIAEKRDRGSSVKLPEIMQRAQRLNAVIYWLPFSPFKEPFTVKPKTKEDLKPEAERRKLRHCATCPTSEEEGVPFDAGPGGYIYAIGELARLKQPDLSSVFTTASGGRALSFVTKSALEKTIQLVGEEVHRQYLLSFEPKGNAPGSWHAIRVEVRNRPGLKIRTRSGYWAVD